MPRLLKLVGRHIGDRPVIPLKDCRVEVRVLVVRDNHRTARPVINCDTVRKDTTAAIHVIFEPRESPDAGSPSPPRFNVAPYYVLLRRAQCNLSHSFPLDACGAWSVGVDG